MVMAESSLRKLGGFGGHWREEGEMNRVADGHFLVLTKTASTEFLFFLLISWLQLMFVFYYLFIGKCFRWPNGCTSLAGCTEAQVWSDRSSGSGL